MNVQSPAALGSTEDYLYLCHRLTTEAFELTPTFDKFTNNMQINTPVSMAGVIPTTVVINGRSVQFTYKSFTVGNEISKESTVILDPLDYALFDNGTYYLNTSTGEYFLCLSKNPNWSVTFRRGLLNTLPSQINTSAIIFKLNTIRIDTATGEETRGVLTLTSGNAPLLPNDKLTVIIDNKMVEYVIDGNLPASSTVAAQALLLRNTLAQEFKNWVFAVEGNNVTATQKIGYAKPFTISVMCIASVPTSAITGAQTTAGVPRSYESGYGYIIFKEIPRNIGYGQKDYPTAYT